MFAQNTKGRDFFVGDLHGEHTQFFDALAAVDFNFDTDRVFSVGDLIDRGPDSHKCLMLLNQTWFHAVRGNHEDLLMGYQGWRTWMMNGGDWINEHLTEDLDQMKTLVKTKMPYTLTVATNRGFIGLVHAESMTHWENNSNTSVEINTWARTKFRRQNKDVIKGIDRVVVGHTPLKRVVTLGNVVYIDTGAVYGEGFLTMLTVDQVFDHATK